MNNQPKPIRGAQLPSDLKLEEAVVGAMLVDSRSIDDCLVILKSPEAFYYPNTQNVFKAIQSLYTKTEPIDLTTISREMRSLGTLEASGGDFYLIELTQKISSGAHAEYHSRLLLQLMVRRMIVSFNQKITGLALDDSVDVFELLQGWSREFDKVNDLILNGRKTMTFKESLQDLGKKIEFLSSRGEQDLVGVHTGFERINKKTGGYQAGELIILAARPGMGKTAKVLKTALENVKTDVPVGFISLEMSMLQLTARMVSLDSNFHLSQLIKTGFDKPKYFETFLDHTHRMGNYPFYVDDSGKSDLTDIVVQARLWKRMYGIKLLVVDYLQLMVDKSKSNNREAEVSSMSRRLKILAKELEIPIIVLSQLSRKVEERPDKRPRLSDLRESGAIEQDADIVEFIYRPEYYGLDVKDSDMLNEGTDTEVIFAKYRAGSVGTTHLKWIGDKTKFVDPTSNAELKYFNNQLNQEGSDSPY